MEVLRETIDGSVVRIQTPDGTQISRPSSVGVFAVEGHWQEFTTTDRDGGLAVATALGIELTQTYSYQHGTLSLGTKTFQDTTAPVGVQRDLLHFGLWEGEYSSVFTHLYNGRAENLIPIFENFDLTDRPLGARVTPRSRKQVTLAKEPSFLQEFSGIGLALVRPLTGTLARRLPKWSGTLTDGGELFIDRRPGSVFFILVGRGVVTEIMPDGEDCEKDVPNLAGMHVAWEPGPLVQTGRTE